MQFITGRTKLTFNMRFTVLSIQSSIVYRVFVVLYFDFAILCDFASWRENRWAHSILTPARKVARKTAKYGTSGVSRRLTQRLRGPYDWLFRRDEILKTI